MFADRLPLLCGWLRVVKLTKALHPICELLRRHPILSKLLVSPYSRSATTWTAAKGLVRSINSSPSHQLHVDRGSLPNVGDAKGAALAWAYAYNPADDFVFDVVAHALD